jgi:hypothetical protein
MKRQDDSTPPTVGFNLKEMRDNATKPLLDAIRRFAREMDKIDMLDEMFNAQHAATIHSNGNNKPAVVRRAPIDLPALREAILTELSSHRIDGRTIGQLYDTLQSRGQAPVSTNREAAKVALRYRLDQLVGEKLVEVRMDGVHPANGQPVQAYYPAARPKRKFSAEGLSAMRASAARARAARKARAKTTI